MKLSLIAIAAVLAAAALSTQTSAASLSEEQYQFLFTKFTQKYKKSYETANSNTLGGVFTKYQTFKNNVDLILAHNARGETFKMGINQFADMTKAEFGQTLGLRVNRNTSKKTSSSLGALPEIPGLNAIEPVKGNTIDWSIPSQKYGKVMNPIKNQAQCMSCWAFSALGSLEPAIAIQTGQLYDLAEQSLVDCIVPGANCAHGGLMSIAFDSIQDNNGLVPLTSEYPYTAKSGKCLIDQTTPIDTKLSGYTVADTEQKLVDTLQVQPVSIGLAADNSAFQFYSSGVITKGCGTEPDHGVVAYGFIAEEDADGKPAHYLIRNSWGTSWGDQGIARIAAQRDSSLHNVCGLMTWGEMNVAPTIKK